MNAAPTAPVAPPTSRASRDAAAPALELRGVGKRYRLYRNDVDRMLEVMTGRPRHEDVVALAGIDLSVGHGEVLGIVGRNGAGKSTLLKLVAGLLPASEGSIRVNGRVAAILELGAAFHPDMTGRENVYLKAAVAGLERAEIEALLPGIVAFADIGPFLDRPARTYSSGMAARLAFAVATAVDPDVLIIDEALSVGDGAFARKSFERIMGFRDAGKTILFCSHSAFHIESICDRVLGIDAGRQCLLGQASAVLSAYQADLDSTAPAAAAAVTFPAAEPQTTDAAVLPPGSVGRILGMTLATADTAGRPLPLQSGRSELKVTVRFQVDPALPAPSLGVLSAAADGRPISSAQSLHDGVTLRRDAAGRGTATVRFPAIALLRGIYGVQAYLMCERGVHFYDSAMLDGALHVAQNGVAQGFGLVTLPHAWNAVDAGADAGCALRAAAEPCSSGCHGERPSAAQCALCQSAPDPSCDSGNLRTSACSAQDSAACGSRCRRMATFARTRTTAPMPPPTPLTPPR